MSEVTKESMPHHDKNQLPVEREFDQASFSSDETQTGVKTVEAVSQTWTQSALIAAYLGYVLLHGVAAPVVLFFSFKNIILPCEDDSTIFKRYLFNWVFKWFPLSSFIICPF